MAYANGKAFEITGYTKEDFANGVCAFDFFEKKDKERIIENFRKALANKPSDDLEYEFVRKDGTTFPAIIKRTPIVVDNKTVGLRGIAIDISGQKKRLTKLLFLASIVQNSDDAIIGKAWTELLRVGITVPNVFMDIKLLKLLANRFTS